VIPDSACVTLRGTISANPTGQAAMTGYVIVKYYKAFCRHSDCRLFLQGKYIKKHAGRGGNWHMRESRFAKEIKAMQNLLYIKQYFMIIRQAPFQS